MPTAPEPGPPAYFDWNGYRWYRNGKDGYYRDRTGHLLHRAVWAAEGRGVPEGHDVHHIDHDRANNTLVNLAPKPVADHRAMHAPAGAHAMWAKRKPVVRVCEQCGETYESRATYSSYCSNACRVRHGYLARRAAHGL